MGVAFGTNKIWRNKNKLWIEDGLILNLDAADSTSYPGSGTTWYDLSPNHNDFTLINGPTYTNDVGGSFSFDGVNDYAARSNLLRLGGQNVSATVEAAFFLPTGGGGYLVMNERETNDTGHGWYTCTDTQLNFQQHATNSYPYVYDASASPTGFSNIKINDWNYVSWSVVVTTSTMTCNYLINGYAETATNSVVFGNEDSAQDNVEIGRWHNYIYGTIYSSFKLSLLRLYNKALTLDEQTFNYNKVKIRYGL